MGELLFEIFADVISYTVYQEGMTQKVLVEEALFDEDSNLLQVESSSFPDFYSFWKVFLQKENWHYFHPLFIATTCRPLIKEALEKVNWNVHPDIKWQQSHQKQWDKVLADPGKYYSK